MEAYLAAVRDELGDLAPNERDDLLAEVEASLLDAAEESEAPIAARLGPPADFAAELRAAAGLAADTAPEPPPKRDLLATAWRSPRAASVKRVLVEVAPIWWVVRGYVVVALIAALGNPDWSVSAPFVPRIGIGGPGDAQLGIVVLLGAVAASVALGVWQRRRGRAGTLSLALNVALAIAALPIGGDLVERFSNRPYAAEVFAESVSTPGLALDGVPVENVYPYSRDGRLMLDVLLYDQNGAPLNVRPGAADPDRRVLRAANGAELYNSFPIRYFDAGTGRVARPGASPQILWSPIVTPPLKRKPER